MNRSTITEEVITTLEPLLDDWAEWDLPLTGRPRLLALVPGGRTNQNFRLSAPGMAGDLLFRLNHPEPTRLGIDRTLEREILSLVASAGIGRPCCHWDQDNRFVLFAYLEGRHWTTADFERPEQRDRLWPLIDRLGDISLDRPRRCYGDYLRHYWNQLEARGSVDSKMRERWLAFEPDVEQFDQAGWTARLVHHDLIPANVLETTEGLLLIDWEYAAQGHPDIDIWSVDPAAVREPIVASLMEWVNDLWSRLMEADAKP